MPPPARRVDAPRTPAYDSRALGIRTTAVGVLGLAAGLAACRGAPPPEPASPFDVRQAALAVEYGTVPDQGYRIVFDWSLLDGPARFRGRGVARLAPPDRVRLDLFSPAGELVARAVVVGDEVRLPNSAQEIPLPPPAFIWAALGIFRPGNHTVLLRGERRPDGEVQLHYAAQDAGDTLVYGVRRRTLHWLEQRDGGHTVERIELAQANGGRFPHRATYRDLRAYRELVVTVDTVEDVESYPPDLWVPER